RGKAYNYYRCTGSIRGGIANHARGFRCDALEAIIFVHLDDFDATEKYRAADDDFVRTRIRSEIATVELHLREIEDDRDRLLRSLDKASGKTADLILSRLDNKLGEITTAEGELAQLRADLTRAIHKQDMRADALTI